MDQNQAQQEISIIKEMIEKTRRETAESGHFFIALGVLMIVNTLAIVLMEYYKLNYLILPMLIFTVIAGFIASYFTVARQDKKMKVKSYTKTVCYNVMLASSIPALMIVFIFPFLKVYQFHLVPILASLFIGSMIFSAGVIFEVKSIKWCSIAWWIGAVIMAVDNEHILPPGSVMILTISIGWMLPGFILNKNYKNGSK